MYSSIHKIGDGGPGNPYRPCDLPGPFESLVEALYLGAYCWDTNGNLTKTLNWIKNVVADLGPFMVCETQYPPEILVTTKIPAYQWSESVDDLRANCQAYVTDWQPFFVARGLDPNDLSALRNYVPSFANQDSTYASLLTEFRTHVRASFTGQSRTTLSLFTGPVDVGNPPQVRMPLVRALWAWYKAHPSSDHPLRYYDNVYWYAAALAVVNWEV